MLKNKHKKVILEHKRRDLKIDNIKKTIAKKLNLNIFEILNKKSKQKYRR